MAGVLGLMWIAVHTVSELLMFAAVFGFFSGAISSLSLNLTVALSPDPGLLGVRTGMLFFPIALGLLLGSPIAGALGRPIAGAIDSTGWLRLQLFTGLALIMAATLIVQVRHLLYGRNWNKKC